MHTNYLFYSMLAAACLIVMAITIGTLIEQPLTKCSLTHSLDTCEYELK